MDLMKFEELDKVTVFFSTKMAKYIIKEVSLHDKNPARLLERAQRLADDLNAGKKLALEVEERVKNQRFQCQKCKSTIIPAFPDKPEEMMLFCPKCSRWQNHKKV